MDAFTLFHTGLSLIGIASGLVVLYGLLKANRMPRLTAVFLTTTALTTLTGFLFPFHGFTPAIGTGIVSTLVLAPAIAGLYAYHLKGVWRPVHVIGSVIALYLNCFVLVVQSFLKIPPLHALAPNGTEPPFLVAQAFTLIAFLAAGYFAFKRSGSASTASAAPILRKAA